MHKPIINLEDVVLDPRPAALAATGPAAERYDARMGFIAPSIGATKLGYNVTAVPPGKRAFPFHNHRVNEEMVLILLGSGEIRIGKDRFPLREGDVVALPAGGPETAHQIINTGTAELRYLAVSTRQSPEIAEYPDSGKFGVLADFAATTEAAAKRLMFVGKENQSLNYWEGE